MHRHLIPHVSQTSVHVITVTDSIWYLYLGRLCSHGFYFCLFFFPSGFTEGSEVWAHWKLWEAGSRHDDDPRTVWRSRTQRGYKGWKLKLLSQQILQFWSPSPNHIVWLIMQSENKNRNNPPSASEGQTGRDLRYGWWPMNVLFFFYSIKQVCLLNVALRLFYASVFFSSGCRNWWSLFDWDSVISLQCRHSWNHQNLQSWWVLSSTLITVFFFFLKKDVVMPCYFPCSFVF